MKNKKPNANRFLAALVGVITLAWLPLPAFAMACAVFSEQGARIRLPGFTSPASTPYLSPQCDNLQVISGQAEVCFARRDGQLACTVAPKGPLNAQTLGANPSGGTEFVATLERLLHGEYSQASGKVRLSARTMPVEVPGFPYRNVLPHAGPVIIPLDGITPARLDAFRLYDMSINNNTNIRLVYRTGPVSGSVTIPAERLKPGIDYEWKAIQDGRRISGAFHAASFQEDVRMRQRIDPIEADPTLSALGKRILEAHAYAAAGYTLNARQLLLNRASLAAGRPSASHGEQPCCSANRVRRSVPSSG